MPSISGAASYVDAIRGPNLPHAVLLLAGFVVLVTVPAVLLWGAAGLLAAPALLVLISGVAIRMPPDAVMRLYQATLVPRDDSQLASLMDVLAYRAELPRRPDLYVIPSLTLNAFAAGSRDHSAIAVTEGLLRRLTLAEIRYAVDQGAEEIDIVITRAHVFAGDWAALYDEVAAMREACGAAHLKAILATGDLATLGNVYAASMVAMQAGADFIKTSTGKEGVNATLPVSLTMLRALRDYGERTGYRIGFKPAGGMKSAKDAIAWHILMREELGRDWLEPDLFRLGASSMLGDIERQLEHHVTGRYAAAHRHAIA